jgi:hypothetical protein
VPSTKAEQCVTPADRPSPAFRRCGPGGRRPFSIVVEHALEQGQRSNACRTGTSALTVVGQEVWQEVWQERRDPPSSLISWSGPCPLRRLGQMTGTAIKKPLSGNCSRPSAICCGMTPPLNYRAAGRPQVNSTECLAQERNSRESTTLGARASGERTLALDIFRWSELCQPCWTNSRWGQCRRLPTAAPGKPSLPPRNPGNTPCPVPPMPDPPNTAAITSRE